MNRRTLFWGAVAVVVAVGVTAIVLARKRPAENGAVIDEPRAVQSGLAILIIQDSAGRSTRLDSLVGRMRAGSGVPVVSASASRRVDVAQLTELINVPSAITLQSSRDSVVAVFFRGDSVQLHRGYALADSSRLAALILADAAKSLDSNIRNAPALEGMGDAFLHLRHADLVFRRGDTLEALREARRAHEIEPLSGEIHLKYAALLDRSGRGGDAARERAEQKRIATILNPTVKDQIARARFKHVPKRPPRSSRPPAKSSGSRSQRAPLSPGR